MRYDFERRTVLAILTLIRRGECCRDFASDILMHDGEPIATAEYMEDLGLSEEYHSVPICNQN